MGRDLYRTTDRGILAPFPQTLPWLPRIQAVIRDTVGGIPAALRPAWWEFLIRRRVEAVITLRGPNYYQR